ncbi:hypothetical protein MTR67_018312 [Solanum verrucosum]|uniref:Uncharacterized protein n=1 Tax=Solanum verrucosum TaxID=315347 RepID=A0AAF0QJG5_SOLVR|nr:hypothetical protein MTR67_018312 [Solanum verrucosum]
MLGDSPKGRTLPFVPKYTAQ